MRQMMRVLVCGLVTACAFAVASPALADVPYQVGTGIEPINPCPDGTFPAAGLQGVDVSACGGGAPVYLGGFGLAGGPVGAAPAQQPAPIPGRQATGVLAADPTLLQSSGSTVPIPAGEADGAHVRAMAIGDGDPSHTLLIADIEAQGYFAELKQAGVGIMDMRQQVAKHLGLDPQQVWIQSDHTHGGADPLGVWGGVPNSFLEYMTAQTEKALEDAYHSMHPADLYYGSVDGADLLTNQFASDPANTSQDSGLRVLQAKDPATGQTIATLLNFSAHADVLGSSNTKLTGDWPSAANVELEQQFGGFGMTMVGTLGRTQPQRGPAYSACSGDSGDTLSYCAIYQYGKQVVDRAAQAVAAATPITGPPAVSAHSYLVEDTATNAPILGLEYAGFTVGAPLYRAIGPPWMTGTEIGTVTGTARIGDVLISSIPGEAYPQIALKVSSTVTGIRPGGFMTAGLSNDQLGYLIAPFSAYPEPAERSLFSQPLSSDVIQGCVASPNTNTCPQPSPVSNDNYFFNVSHTMGERLTCSLLRGADDVLHPGQTTFHDSYTDCNLFANDAVLPPGTDVTASNALPKLPDTSNP